jgi:hypothetical protein
MSGVHRFNGVASVCYPCLCANVPMPAARCLYPCPLPVPVPAACTRARCMYPCPLHVPVPAACTCARCLYLCPLPVSMPVAGERRALAGAAGRSLRAVSRTMRVRTYAKHARALCRTHGACVRGRGRRAHCRDADSRMADWGGGVPRIRAHVRVPHKRARMGVACVQCTHTTTRTSRRRCSRARRSRQRGRTRRRAGLHARMPRYPCAVAPCGPRPAARVCRL